MNFQELLNETQIAYEKSDIKSHNWFYSISSTPLKEKCTLLVGFNWGVGKNEIHKPQQEIPSIKFKDLKDKGSFQRVYLPLKKYLPLEDIDNCVQTNFCFFRSEKENQITERDLALSTPLFSLLIDMLKPKMVIGFSRTFQKHFSKIKSYTEIEATGITLNNKTLFVSKGTFGENGTQVPIYFLPHPNAPFLDEARKKAWEFCFPD